MLIRGHGSGTPEPIRTSLRIGCLSPPKSLVVTFAPLFLLLQTVGSLFRTLTEGVLSYVTALALDLQVGALLSDAWSATARILRDCEYPVQAAT